MLQLIQIGMNSSDLAGSLRLYSEVFGYENAGGQGFWGPMAAIQGLGPDARVLVWWLVGGDEFFQLELFHHTNPAQRPLPPDWRSSDLGWSRFGVAVSNLPAAIAALRRNGVAHSVIMGSAGARRIAFRDPYVGVYIEILEVGAVPDRLPGASGWPRVIYATTSVSDLEAARVLYENTLGFATASLDGLHQSEHELLWNLDGAQREGFLVECGSRVIEVVQYSNPPGRAKRADYRCSDQGIVNVALGSRNLDEVRAALARMAALGSIPPMCIDTESLVAAYITDAQRELEFLGVKADMDTQLGFTRMAPFITG